METIHRTGRSWRGRLVAAAVIVLLIAVGSVVDWHRLSVDGLDGVLNDQVGYVSVARDLADHGKLDSQIVYPLLLRQPARRNSLYMPGFYWVLGAFIKLFGYSPVIARVPSILAFLLACYLIYWIASRVYGDKAPIYSTMLFAAVPVFLVFAFTAMMETPLIAAGLAAFAIFLRVGERVRPWVAPVAVLLPFLFRESGIIVGIVMLAVLVREAWLSPQRSKRLGYVFVSAILMVVLCGAVLKSPVGSGRPSLWKANVLVGRNYESLYGNAFGTDRVPSEPSDWADAIQDKYLYNVHVLVRPKGESAGFFEQSVLWFILSGIPLGIFLGIRKRDPFALGTSTAVLLLLIACFALYPLWGYRAVRVLAILYPFVGMLWGSVIAGFLKRFGRSVEVIFVGLLVVLGSLGTIRLIRAQASADRQARADTEFLESIVGQDRRMVVSPFWLSMEYINQHYPQDWAFVPSNCESLRLLDERYRIGVLVVAEPESDTAEAGVPRLEADDASCGTALKFSEQREYGGTDFWIYRREMDARGAHP